MMASLPRAPIDAGAPFVDAPHSKTICLVAVAGDVLILPLALVHRLERGAVDYVDVELAQCFGTACYLGTMHLGAVDYREKLLTVQDTGRVGEALVGCRSTPPRHQ